MSRPNLTCSYEDCSKAYSNLFNLNRHIESFHLGLKKFFCIVCGKGLSTKQNMREHMFIHEGTKPYACEFPSCQEAFRQLSQLKMHQNMHKALEKYFDRKVETDLIKLGVFAKALSEVKIDKTFEMNSNEFEVPKIFQITKDLNLDEIQFC